MKDSVMLTLTAKVNDARVNPIDIDVNVSLAPEIVDKCVSKSPDEREEIVSDFNSSFAEAISLLVFRIKELEEREVPYGH